MVCPILTKKHKEYRVKLKRQNGGGSVMVWGAITAHGVLDLKVCTNNMAKEEYIRILERSLLLFLRRGAEHEYKFMQDNSSELNATQTLEVIEGKGNGTLSTAWFRRRI